jgi:hypothetical protein
MRRGLFSGHSHVGIKTKQGGAKEGLFVTYVYSLIYGCDGVGRLEKKEEIVGDSIPGVVGFLDAQSQANSALSKPSPKL